MPDHATPRYTSLIHDTKRRPQFGWHGACCDPLAYALCVSYLEILWQEKIQNLLNAIFASNANKGAKQFLGLPKLLRGLRADQRLKTHKIIRGRLRQMVANGTLAQANAKVKRINGRNVTDIVVSPGRTWTTMRKTRSPHGNVSVVQRGMGERDATVMRGVASGVRLGKAFHKACLCNASVLLVTCLGHCCFLAPS